MGKLGPIAIAIVLIAVPLLASAEDWTTKSSTYGFTYNIKDPVSRELLATTGPGTACISDIFFTAACSHVVAPLPGVGHAGAANCQTLTGSAPGYCASAGVDGLIFDVRHLNYDGKSDGVLQGQVNIEVIVCNVCGSLNATVAVDRDLDGLVTSIDALEDDHGHDHGTAYFYDDQWYSDEINNGAYPGDRLIIPFCFAHNSWEEWDEIYVFFKTDSFDPSMGTVWATLGQVTKVGDRLSDCNLAPSPACNDGIDNDGDGYTDYPSDPGCSSLSDNNECCNPPPPPPSYACNDGYDNDGDGYTDYPSDPGCSSSSDGSECCNPACSNGIDDDGDGYTDLSDPGCSNKYDSSERGTHVCDDGEDNDGDGWYDYPAGASYGDDGCSGPTDNDECNWNDGTAHVDYRTVGSGWGNNVEITIDYRYKGTGCTDPPSQTSYYATACNADAANGWRLDSCTNGLGAFGYQEIRGQFTCIGTPCAGHVSPQIMRATFEVAPDGLNQCWYTYTAGTPESARDVHCHAHVLK